MNRMISMMAVVLVSLTVSAEAYFSIVNTVAHAAKDSSPSDAHAGYYSGYLCTVANADLYFGDGNTTAAKMTDYVLAHYDQVISDLDEGLDVTKLAADGEGYSFGQYAVSAFSATPFASGDYLALLVYFDGENQAFRAFGEGCSSFANGSVTFEDNGSGTATTAIGAWTDVIPEPTSGLLLLIGLAGLALRRRRIGSSLVSR